MYYTYFKNINQKVSNHLRSHNKYFLTFSLPEVRARITNVFGNFLKIDATFKARILYSVLLILEINLVSRYMLKST